MSTYVSLRSMPVRPLATSPSFLLDGVLPEYQITPYHRDQALMSLFPFVFGRLSRRMQNHLRRPESAPVDAAVLVHSTYADGVAQGDLLAAERAPFLAVAALAMRQVLVSEARRRPAQPGAFDQPALVLRRGVQGNFHHLEGEACWHDVLSVHGALKTLAKHKVRWVSLVECRYFAGLSPQDTALALDLTLDEVTESWQQVTTWLGRYLQLKAAA